MIEAGKFNTLKIVRRSEPGIYLNGERINEAIELKDKDLIDIGQVEFLFVNGDDDNEK